jgi:hypothetical protein
MPSFQRTVWLMSMRAPSIWIPSVLSPIKLRDWRKASAAWIMALDGMQPMIRQVPLSCSPSTSVVAMPSCAARMPVI